MNQGVHIKTHIKNDVTNDWLLIKEFIIFKKEDISKVYLPNLTELIEDGIISYCTFDDNTWVGEDEFEIKSTLNFPLELHPDFNIALKCYAILKLSKQYTTIGNVRNAINYISNALLSCNMLNPDYLETFQDEIKFWNVTQLRNHVFLKEFLRFFPTENSSMYYEVLDSISCPQAKPRNLPCYRSIITFDYIIKDFMNSYSIEKINKFYPIIIWWELTKIIPMRPIEVAILRRNCLSINKETNEKFISIERRKSKGGKIKYKRIKILTKIKIEDDLYNLINNYIKFSSNTAKGDFIFSNETYKSIMSKVTRNSKIDFMGMYSFRRLLDKFFNEIIANDYGYEVISKQEYSFEIPDNQIEKIQLGDTRHIAFCSMMLQGFNPLTIAQIGGHYTLTEQMSYYSHLDTFVSSYTYVMSKNLQNKISSKINISKSTNMLVSKEKIIQRELLKDKFYLLRKVRGGRCCSDNFPYECNCNGHIYCDFFIPDETLTKELLNKELYNVENEISLKIKYIKSLSKYLVGSTHADSVMEELKINCNALGTLMNQSAILNSYKLNEMEDYNESCR